MLSSRVCGRVSGQSEDGCVHRVSVHGQESKGRAIIVKLAIAKLTLLTNSASRGWRTISRAAGRWLGSACSMERTRSWKPFERCAGIDTWPSRNWWYSCPCSCIARTT